jgi:Fe-S-cluster containining protein
MLISLGETKPRGEEFGGGLLHYYTCKNLSPAGDCVVYESRPTMCRDYPYGNPCDHAGTGCTL